MWSDRLGYCGHLGLHSVAVAENRHTLTACMRLMSGMCSGLTDCSHDDGGGGQSVYVNLGSAGKG